MRRALGRLLPISFVLCVLPFVLLETTDDSDGSNVIRILYNIGHMADDIPQADQFIADGANALEVDVRFERNGSPTRLYHGVPCDCFRTCHRTVGFGEFLDHVKQRSTPGSSSYTDRLALLLLDLKLEDVDQHEDPLYAAGDQVAGQVIERLYQNGTSGSKLWIVVGIPLVSHSAALRGFQEAFARYNVTGLLEKVGYEVTDEDNMDVVQQSLRGLGIRSGIWQGDGITNCIAGRSDARLRQAIVKRDAPSGPWVVVDKVYRWTIDTKTAIRHSLRLGVDGIMTNDPDDVVLVVQEPEFSYRYRLATNADNPHVKVMGPGPLRFGCSSNYCWKDCTFTGRWCWTGQSGCSSDPTKCSLNLACSGSCGTK